MDTLLLTPGGLLLAIVLLVVLFSSARGLQRPAPTVVYIPVETRQEPGNVGCLPLALLIGVLVVVFSGML
jgi:hypothetical protein